LIANKLHLDTESYLVKGQY